MLHKKIAICATAALFALGGCTATADSEPPRLTEKQAARLDKALEGKVAGQPVACAGRVGSTGRLEVISDGVLLYRANRDLVYVNRLSGECSGISRGDTLVLKPTVSQYCSGDIARSVDFSIGMTVGSCALGEFVPYRTPGS
jgi:hypothetical protein